MALAVETGTYTASASYFDPNGNGTNTAWTGDYLSIDDAVRSPTNAATGGDGNSISTGTAGALEDTNFTTGTYDSAASYVLYIFSESGAKRGLSVSVNAGSSFSTIHGASAAQAWRTLDVTSQVTSQATLDAFSVRWRCDSTAGGGGAGSVTVHAAYLAAYDPTPTISLGSNFTGITPKAVILWSNEATSATVVETASHALSFGFATYDGGAAQNRCTQVYRTHNATPGASRVITDSYCVGAGVNASTASWAWGGSLSSFASAAFTLNFSTGGYPPNNTRIHYMALGGDEISAARAGHWVTAASASTDDVTVATSWGQPDYLFVTGNMWTNGINSFVASTDSPFLLGAGSSASDVRTSELWYDSGSANFSQYNDNQLVYSTGNTYNTTDVVGTLSAKGSWPTDGFQISYSDTPGFAYYYLYLALKGTFLTNTGVNQMPASAGNQTLTGNASGAAKGAFIWGAPTLAATGLKTANEGSSAQIAAFNIGATDGTNEAAIGMSSSLASPTTLHRTSRNDKAFVVRVPNSTTEYLADGSLSSANVILNWASVDATDRRYYHYVVFSSSVGGAITPTGLVHSRALGSPKVNPSVVPSGLARTRALGALSVVSFVAPSGLVHSRALGSPKVNPSVAPSGLARTRALGSPKVNPSVAPSGLARTRALGAPTVAVVTFVAPAGLEHTRAFGAPQVNPSIPLAGLDHARALGALDLDTTLFPAGLDHARAVGSHAVSPSVLPAGLVHTRVLGDVAAIAASSIVPASLVRSRALGALVLNPTVSPSGLSHTRALGAPSVSPVLKPLGLSRSAGGGALGGLIYLFTEGGARALGVPRVVVGVNPSGLEHTRALGNPTLHPRIVLAGIDHARSLGSPFVGVMGESPGSHTHSIHPHQHRDGDSP